MSAVSGWEIAITRASGRLRFPDVDREMLAALGLTELPLTLRHAAAVGALPDHHRDPFDRMLVAQARTDNLMIISRDRPFASYEVALLW